MKISRASLAAILSLPPAMTPYAAAGEHEFEWGSRSRYAEVQGDQSGKAASLLVRFTLKSDWNEVFRSAVEVDHVSSFFKDDHSDGVRFNNQPLIPDPPGTEFNQAFVTVDLDRLDIQVGRQRINFDNQRFIGGNGFWQNEQTFDAALGKFSLLSNSHFIYSYIANVNRIYGDKGGRHLAIDDAHYTSTWGIRPAGFLGDHKHHSHLARLEWNEWDYTRVVGYAYAIDNRDMSATSNDTLGISYQWKYKLNAITYRAHLETALQKRPEIAGSEDLAYYLADLGAGLGAFEFSGRYEVLGGKNNLTFVTPLASGNNFSGWADEAVNIATEGLTDLSVGLLWRSSPFRVETKYHTFKEQQSQDSIGTEFDVDFTYKPARKHSVSLRFAYFMPDANVQPERDNIRKFFLDYAYNL